MRILVLTESLRLGGAETQAVALANGLKAAGQDVFFAAADGPLRARLDSGVEFHPIPSFSLSGALPLLLALRRIFRATSPDVVHSQGATLALISAAARIPSRLPSVVMTHHIRASTRSGAKLAARLINLSCDRVVALTAEKVRGFTGSGVNPGKVTRIPNFVEASAYDNDRAASRREVCAELGIPDDSLICVACARLIPGKRLDSFIRVLSAAATRATGKVAGIIVGDGPERGRLAETARMESGKALVKFAGYREDVRPFLASADVALFPTELEVLPMFLIEAAAAGLPIVCTDLKANREVVSEGENGLLADGEAGLADALVRLLSDQALRARMGEAGRALARERFDRAPVIKRLLETYSAALAERK